MFTPEERRIFGPYDNGRGQKVYGDPAALYRRLIHYTQGALNDLLARYQQGDEGVASSAEQLANATILAFGLPCFEAETGQGTLQDEALELLREFLDWRDQKKTTAANSPTSAPPTARAGSRPPLAERARVLAQRLGEKLPPHSLVMGDSITRPTTDSR